MNEKQWPCPECSGVKEAQKNMETNITSIWKAVDTIRVWIVLGMASLILEGIHYFAGHIHLVASASAAVKSIAGMGP
jgi:hypothetical protein